MQQVIAVAVEGQDAPASRPIGRGVGAIFPIVVGLAAAIMVLADGVAQQAVAQREPALAEALAPGDAGVQRLAAETALFRRDARGAAEHARRALRSAPLDIRALRTLGLAEDRGRGGADPAVTALFNLSAQLSWRDRATQLWLLRRSVRDGDADGAAQRIDALLRVDPLQPALMGLVDQLAIDPGGRAALVERLADNPPWRDYLLVTLPVGTPEHIAAWVALLRALARTATPPRTEETGRWLTQLVDAGHGAEAYAAWSALEHGRPGGSLIVDPDFADAAILGDDDRRPPFAWHVTSGRGAQFEAGPVADVANALSLSQEGSGALEAVYQTVVLSPGRYAMSFRAFSESPAALALVRMAVSCPGASQALADVRPKRPAVGWNVVGATFEVPGAGCPVQRVAFSLDPSDSSVSPPVALRGVRIVRVIAG